MTDTPRSFTSAPPIIILKLDDITDRATPRWQRVTEFLAQRRIKSAFGLICQALERADAARIQEIKDLQASGLVEIWLHGYTLRGDHDRGEFEQGTFEEHKALLDRSEVLAREKLGFALRTFGPHWSATTEQTVQALNAVPEIHIYLCGHRTPNAFRRLSLPGIMDLENPVFVPDFDKFKSLYETIGCKERMLVLQGHPDAWADAARWEGFVKIIDFLQAQRCVFMTPTEYEASLKH